jgi:hypothetical protein
MILGELCNFAGQSSYYLFLNLIKSKLASLQAYAFVEALVVVCLPHLINWPPDLKLLASDASRGALRRHMRHSVINISQ